MPDFQCLQKKCLFKPNFSYQLALRVTFIYFFLSFYITIQADSELPTVQPNERAPIDSTFHKDLIKGLDYISKNRYREALVIFDSLQQIFPNHPAPNFYIAATYQSWMLTFRFNKFKNDLYENAKLAIDKGTKMLEIDNDPWLNFYVGSAYGYKALHRFRQHNWIGAYIDGRKGIKNFNTALEKLPNLYDCYYGLGAYNYWRTAKSKFIMRGRLMVWFKEWSEVQDIFQQILNRLIAQPYQSISYQVECKYWIAEALNAQNQLDQAYELATLALAQSKEWIKDNELENPLENFGTIKKRLKKLHERLRKELAK